MPYDIERTPILGGIRRIIQAPKGSYPSFVDASRLLAAEASGLKRLAERLLKVLESSQCFDTYDAAFNREFDLELMELELEALIASAGDLGVTIRHDDSDHRETDSDDAPPTATE